MNVSTPEIREIDAREVASVSFTGNYLGNASVFEKLFGTLCGWAGAQELISPETRFVSAYYNDPDTTPPEELRVDVCMTIPPGTEIPTEGEVQRRTLPGGKYAVMKAELTGPEEYGPVWYALAEWLGENNVELDLTRPGYEYYLNCPDEDPEKLHRVEICLGVK
ncbi:GyrI-like domain-containing protein [Methanocalculus taiwanensis]|uniref:GyrI-like domain-containing protein n=1 Tax=Methanocalculus taiwanensis TaxID=106207 RepID=A0ABD4TGI5_9EURY|nr:GyrI-like domain-containing protein [Methanocalculus taiwanensis]MCQ1537407.1 GyrI-like domain-containing protein [Methanocalculus taiwanensis]